MNSVNQTEMYRNLASEYAEAESSKRRFYAEFKYFAYQYALIQLGMLVYVIKHIHWVAAYGVLAYFCTLLRGVEYLREMVGCDPPPITSGTMKERALAMVLRAVHNILYRSTVRQTWPQFVMGCHQTTYQLRDFRYVLAGSIAIISLMVIYKVRKSCWQKLPRMVDLLLSAPEGLIPGNPILNDGRIPKGQVSVAVKKEGKLFVVGAGLRMENYLITPTHNTMSSYDLYIIRGDAEEKVDTDSELSIAPDVSAFPVPEKVWARLGVSMITLGPLRNVATVAIVSCIDNKWSTATLRPTQPLGRCVYEGSTQPGFSGSAYTNGAVTVGMHAHGGCRGGGYEVLYIYTRLKIAIDQPSEDSSDFLVKLSRVMFEHEDIGTDVLIRTDDGKYHRTKSEIWEEMQKKDRSKWAEEVEYEELEDQLNSAPESLLQAGFSGEGRRPATTTMVVQPAARSPRASPLSPATRVPQHANQGSLTPFRANDSSVLRNFAQQMSESWSTKLAELMDQQTSRLMQNGIVSIPNSQPPRNGGKKSRSQPKTNNKSS